MVDADGDIDDTTPTPDLQSEPHISLDPSHPGKKLRHEAMLKIGHPSNRWQTETPSKKLSHFKDNIYFEIGEKLDD